MPLAAHSITWSALASSARHHSAIGVFPTLWLGLFSNDPDVFRVGGLYLHIVAPTYFFFGAGLSLFYVSLGRGVAAAGANAVRLAVNVTGGLIAVYWLDLGMVGFFASVVLGFVVYAALLIWAVLRVKEPAAGPKAACENSSAWAELFARDKCDARRINAL